MAKSRVSPEKWRTEPKENGEWGGDDEARMRCTLLDVTAVTTVTAAATTTTMTARQRCLGRSRLANGARDADKTAARWSKRNMDITRRSVAEDRRRWIAYLLSQKPFWLSRSGFSWSALPSPHRRTHESHITPCVMRNCAYACQISRRETHVTSIKFILTAILLGNLSFVPWFCSHWPAARMPSTGRPIAVLPVR